MRQDPNPLSDMEDSESTLLKEPLERFVQKDQTMRLYRALSVLNADIDFDESTSVSVCRRRPGQKDKITIGTKLVPKEVSVKWNMGTHDEMEQVIIKLSHELAHVFQKQMGYEQALVDFLNGSNDIPEYTKKYIQLYGTILETGAINPLTLEQIYREQNKGAGLMRHEILEDITELISAYFVSDEYFLYRLDKSVSGLTHEQKSEVAKIIVELCAELN